MNTEEIASTELIEESDSLSPEIESIAIQRLIDEVRVNDGAISPTAYNRTYNRHNR